MQFWMCLSLDINYLVATRKDNDDVLLRDECGTHVPNMNAVQLR